MAEKILNTRLRLKYDTWSEWVKVENTFVPLKGEVCIIDVPAETNADKSIIHEPAVLFKVGDGEKTFKALPFVSALAGDVPAWAKRTVKADGTTPIEEEAFATALADIENLKAFFESEDGSGDTVNILDKLSALEATVGGHTTSISTINGTLAELAAADAALKKALQEEIDADVKVVTDYIADNEAAWLEKYDDTDLKAAQKLVDEAQDKALTDYKAEMVTAMANADAAAQGYASAAESAAKGYADQKLLDFENAYIKADDNNTIDKLNEIAAWISDDEAGATKIISDVATNAANIKTINESAVMTSGITATKVGEYDTVKSTVDTNKSTWDGVVNKLDASTYNTFVGTTYATLDAAVAAANSHADSKDADIAKGVDAQGRVATLEGKVATWDGKQDALTGAQLAAVNSGVTAEKVGQYDVAVGQAATALQPAALIPYSTTEQMNAAIATATTDMATNASVDAKIGVSVSVENGPTGVYAAIQGATTNTVKDCVDSINAVTTQLTWGEF
jgi:hypothetical protein